MLNSNGQLANSTGCYYSLLVIIPASILFKIFGYQYKKRPFLHNFPMLQVYCHFILQPQNNPKALAINLTKPEVLMISGKIPGLSSQDTSFLTT